MEAETLAGAGATQRAASAATLTVATWNIHGAIGCDGRYAPARIVDVLGEIDADVVALQEVASAQVHSDFLAGLEHETGYHVVAGLLRQRHGSDFGNAVLSRFPVRSVERLDLAIDDYEPRGALDVCLDIGLPFPMRVVATHLGLRPGERREQVRAGCHHSFGSTPTLTPAISSIGRMTAAMSLCPRPRSAASA